MFGAVLNRLATSVRRALSKYAVGTQEPELAFDFIDNKYTTNNSTSNFASAITHSRSGNAVMTDGYGPELIDNPSFSDTSFWTTTATSPATSTIANGVATIVSPAGEGATCQADILTVGKVYEVTVKVKVRSGSCKVQLGSGATSKGTKTFSSSGTYTFVRENDGTDGVLFLARSGACDVDFDDISVREIPVLKWAPHNVSPYSEQFDQWTQDDVTVSLNSITAPNGTTTADKIVEDSDNSNHFVSRNVGSVVAGATYTSSVFAKAGEVSILQASHSFLANTYANFDLSSGTVTAKSSSVVATITDVGDGWYLCEAQSPYISSGTAVNAWMLQESETATRGAAYQGDGTSGLYLWGAHFYRSDLGGMVDNPDQPASRASYVPTTSSAVYLPRVGHHVYNGSAWVNEGLLAESESRTNLATHSDMSSATVIGSTRTADNAVSPDGTENAFTITASSTAPAYIRYSGLLTSGQSYAVSVYAKAGTHDIIRIANVSSSTSGQWFDLTNGTLLTSNGANNTATIQEVGNGWYRCTRYFDSVTTGSSDEIFIANSSADGATSAVSGSTFHLYGFQVENNATSSSFIPTSGSSVTRAAETFTIPSANLPWPSPQYIGSELVTNGTFDDASSLDDWAGVGADIANTTFDNGTIKIFGNSAEYQAITTVVGKVYAASVEVTAATATNSNFRVGTTANGTQNIGSSGLTVGSHTFYFVATATTSYVTLKTNYAVGDTAKSTNFDNVSVREINPLSVSIAMDGRVTYADDDSYSTSIFYRWFGDANNYFVHRIDTALTQTGHQVAQQRANGVDDYSTGNPTNTMFSPDVLVPFDVAVRHGSTFVQVASDGLSPAPNTTPTALPDLSANDLNLAYDYMGTIGTFRVWDKDLGDTGLVEATNPSLEPSLSLTFEGTGTNSFVVNDWSE